MSELLLISEAAKQEVRHALGRMKIGDKIKNHLCQRLVSCSAYWYAHPSGGPAKAPKDGERVIDGSIDFGANTLLVGEAIQAMINVVEGHLAGGLKAKSNVLDMELKAQLEYCVLNAQGAYYNYYAATYDDYMHFGSHAINTSEFIREFCRLAKLHLISV